jgi:hypothetical protein
MPNSHPDRNPCSATAPLGWRLRAEWNTLTSDPKSIRHATQWMLVDAPLRSLDDVLAATGFDVANTALTERALRRLVLAAADGDGLAARVVIQRLLPGLISLSVRRAQQADAPLDELIGAAWIAIRTYNPRRRPTCIAAALIGDADYRAFRHRWRRAARLSERPTASFDDELSTRFEPAVSADDELADLFRSALEAGIPAGDLDLLHQIVDDIPTTVLAAEHAVTPRTIRNRRDRLTAQLRQLVQAA